MNLKFTCIAAAGLLAIFLVAEVAEAGKTGISRTRPGSGFHNRPVGGGTSYSRSRNTSRSWINPQRHCATPGTIVRTPRVEALVGESSPRHGKVARSQRVVSQPGIVMTQPRVVSERVITTQSISAPAQPMRHVGQAVTPDRK